MSSVHTPGEPEPIEAEFEPAVETSDQESRKRSAQSRRSPGKTDSKQIGWTEFGLGLIIATFASVGVSTVISRSSGAGDIGSGSLVREVDGVRNGQKSLTSKADQASADIIALRARVDSQAEELAARLEAEQALRRDLESSRELVAGLLGGGDTDAALTAAPDSPLGRLMARIRAVETSIEDDATAPQTTRQMQRTVRDLAQRVEALDDATTELSDAFERRRAAIAALEDGLERIERDISTIKGDVTHIAKVETEIGAVRQSVTDLASTSKADRAPVLAAAAESRAIRAIDSVETAARKGRPFLNQYRALAALMPDNPEVAALRDIARTGAPTQEELQRDFKLTAERADNLASAKAEDGWNWLRSAMDGVVTVRRTDADTETLRIINSARASMEAGDLRGALESISDLKGEPASVFRTWRESAEHRAELDDRIQSLTAQILNASRTDADQEG